MASPQGSAFIGMQNRPSTTQFMFHTSLPAVHCKQRHHVPHMHLAIGTTDRYTHMSLLYNNDKDESEAVAKIQSTLRFPIMHRP